jgi:4-hydroxybenzoate polyprenyltransferase
MFRKIRALLEMIKVSHTLFALPFGLMGAFLAARHAPAVRDLAWIVVAMAGARTSAMAFNRIVDRRFDAANPRTSQRALPRGTVRVADAWVLVAAGAAVFLWASSRLNPMTLALAPVVLALALGYSFTKRFTSLSHLVLGSALALAPVGGFVAVRGSFAGFPPALALGVVLWVAGFDVVYACQDVGFDRGSGLRSIPAWLGEAGALRLAAALHAGALAALVWTGIEAALGPAYFIALAPAGAALLWQHRLVRPDDLSRMQTAFFTMNAAFSAVLFAGTWISLS